MKNLILLIIFFLVYGQLEAQTHRNSFRQLQIESHLKKEAFNTILTQKQSTGDWKQLPSFVNGRERAFTFIINDQLYVGGGRSDRALAQWTLTESDVHAFNFSTETWTEVASLPIGIRNAAGFSLNGFGYIMGGYSEQGLINSVYKYDPNSNQWEQLSDFPAPARSHSSAFVIDDIAYTACGGADPLYYSELWSFDGQTETWTQMADFPGAPRWRSFQFVIDGKAYVGGGQDFNGGLIFNDVYEYDPTLNSWTQKADYPSDFLIGNFNFEIGNYGYVGDGINTISAPFYDESTDVYRYDPLNDEWAQVNSIEGGALGRTLSFSASYNGKGYVGGGIKWNGFSPHYNDFWEFTPDVVQQWFDYELWDEVSADIQHSSSLNIEGIHMPTNDVVWGVTYSIDQTATQTYYVRSVDGGITLGSGEVDAFNTGHVLWSIYAMDENTAFVPSTETTNYFFNLYKTTDGGNSWQPITADFTNSTILEVQKIHFFDALEGIAIGTDWANSIPIAYKTTNGGDDWIRINKFPTLSGAWYSPYSGNGNFSAKGDSIWFGLNSDHRIVYSFDRGTTWLTYETPFESTAATVVAFKDHENGMAVSNDIFFGNHNAAAITNDAGRTWTEIDIPNHPRSLSIEHIPGTSGSFIVHDGLFSATTALTTHDFGTTWEIMDKMPDLSCIYFYDTNEAWAGAVFQKDGSGALFKFTGDFTVGIEDIANSNIQTLQVHPNPANNTIWISVPEGVSSGKIQIYNSRGQLVMENEIDNRHDQISLPVNELPNGFYQTNM